jgi:nucleoid-associated protein YgaU
MRHRRTALFLSAPLLLALSGCGYVHVGRLPVPSATVIGNEQLVQENADLKLEKKLLQQELALTRAQGEALRMTIESRAADGDTSRRLVEKLNATSQELAALRASYAQLQSERGQPGAAAEAAALRSRLGEAEDKLAASLRSYTELQEEIGRLKSEVVKTRTENLALTQQVQVITAENEQAQAALAQLNRDLLAQKDARLRAEQDAATLRSAIADTPGASALAQQRTRAAADARSLASEHAAETAALKQQLEHVRAQLDSLAAERAELVRKLSQAASPSAELAHIEARLASALQENAELKASSTVLAAQLAKARSAPAGAELQDIREQLRETLGFVTALTEENARLKSQLTRGAAPAPVIVAAVEPALPNANGLIVRPSGVSATLVTSGSGSIRVGTPPESSDAKVRGAERAHVVAAGDTLAKISAQYYGTPGRWNEILAANRDLLGDNNNLVIGRTLRIP